MLQHSLIAVRYTVMGFVNNDGIKIISRETSQPLFSHQCLYRANHYPEPAALAGAFCLFQGTSKPGCLHQLICCLIEQLPSVCQDQYAVTFTDTFLCYLGKYHSLSTACRKDQQGF